MINEFKELNDDWVECTLGAVCDVNMGQSPPSSTYNTDKIGLPFFQGKAEFTELYPVVRKWCSQPKRTAKKGDILLSVRAPVGSTNIADQDCAIGRGLAAISWSMSNSYIWYYLKSINQKLDSQGTGTTFKAISGNILKSQIFPLPPLAIQRAIVSKIETLFSDLDNGISNLKKVQEQLKIYRQAVLKKAFEGEFSSNIGKKNRNIIQLGDVIDKPKYGTSKKCSENSHGVAVLRIPNIGLGFINTEVLKYAEFDSNEISTLALKEGDILTIRSNGSIDLVGKCAVITKDDTKYLYAGYLIRLRPNHSKINSKYLLHCLKSHELRIQIESKAKSTSGVNNINSKELQSLNIPIFPLKEQHKIVREIESRLSVCDKIEESIAEALEKAEALRQSILKKAFEGKLLSKAEIEACKQDADYEPASELLKKINKDKLKKS